VSVHTFLRGHEQQTDIAMRQLLRTWLAAAAVGTLGAFMLGALAATSAFAQAPKVKVWGASATVEAYHGFLFLGNPLGFYKDEGVEVEFGTAAGSAATLQLVAAGQVQMGYLGMDVLILAKARNPNLPVTAVYLHDRGNIYEVVVPDGSDIKSIQDLKDKNIGVANLASGAIPSLRATLTDAGLNPDTSVGLIPVGVGAQAAAALRSGRVQALSLFRAQHALVETLGFNFRYFTREAPSTVIVVNSNFLKDNREAVAKTLRAIAKASVFAEANAEATVRAFWGLFGKPQGLAEDEAMKRQKHVLQSSAKLWKDYKDSSVKWGEMSAAQWNGMQKFLIDQKLLNAPVPVETLFTTDLIEFVNTFPVDAVLKHAQSVK
jgi:NitT/TauT family transport system substrate-binding protein